MCASLLAPLQSYLVGALSASSQPPVYDALDAISLRSWFNSPWTAGLEQDIYKATNMVQTFVKVGRGGNGMVGWGHGGGDEASRLQEGGWGTHYLHCRPAMRLAFKVPRPMSLFSLPVQSCQEVKQIWGEAFG
jgi:hypothetical protein